MVLFVGAGGEGGYKTQYSNFWVSLFYLDLVVLIFYNDVTLYVSFYLNVIVLIYCLFFFCCC